MKLTRHESQNLDFKQSWHDEYLHWICAYANTEGGTLFIGVKDDGTVIGVDDPKKLSEDIPSKIRSTMGLVPEVKLLSDGDKTYIQINVEKYPFPVSCKGKYYKRVGSTTQELSGVELDKMILFVYGRTWDSVPIPHVTVDDLENDAIRLFKKKALDSGRLDSAALDVSNETLIKNLRLFENDYLTRAAILAFHPDPERWMVGAYIKVAYFENEADILYQDEIHGPLILQVEKTIELIYTKYMKALISYDDIYRQETFFFPRAAFRELILNAAIHKDYFSTTPIQIRIYKDRIRLWNEGTFPKEVTLENLFKEHISRPCNPILANIFFKCGMIESWGRGFEKIVNYCEYENAKLPEIELGPGNSVTARCFASDKYLALARELGVDDDTLKSEITPEVPNKTTNVPVNVPVTAKNTTNKVSDDTLNDTLNSEEKLLLILQRNNTATQKELSEEIGVSIITVKRIMEKLQNENKIERVGAKKNGYWKIIEDGDAQ